MIRTYAPSWPRFLEYFGERFSDDVKDVIPQLGARILELIKELEGGPFTIAHGDYRADNLFFGRAGSAYDVAVIDWQSPNKGWATYDLSYFICGSFDTDLRHEHEKTLGDTYYAGLIAGGVTAYGREQFEADYGRSLLVYLALFVVTGATVDTANERGLALFNAMFDRLNGSIADANALQYLA